jgi:hypothetical protein
MAVLHRPPFCRYLDPLTGPASEPLEPLKLVDLVPQRFGAPRPLPGGLLHVLQDALIKPFGLRYAKQGVSLVHGHVKVLACGQIEVLACDQLELEVLTRR